MLNFHVEFNVNNLTHKIDIQENTEQCVNSVSILGKTYTLLGEREDIELIKNLFIGVVAGSSIEKQIKEKLIESGVSAENFIENKIRVKLMEKGAEKIIISALAVLGKKEVLDPKETVNDICNLMEKKYIFPEVAKKCSKCLRSELEKGSYEGIVDKEFLCQVLIADLRMITEDKHIDIWPKLTTSTEQIKETDVNFRVQDYGDGIKYINLNTFCFDSPKPIADAMEKIRDSKCVIIDLRDNQGGSPVAVQDLCSYFLDPDLPLNKITWRTEDGIRLDEFNTFSYKVIPPEKRMANTPIYILTSNHTFSAAEEFANNMKELGRATIVGEVTGGGANPGSVSSLSNDLEIFIPNGQASNPISGTNWEGVGVIPHQMTSADEALKMTLEMAKKEQIK